MWLAGALELRSPGRYTLLGVLAVAAGAVRRGLLFHGWPRTTRDVLARQILFTGVEATGFTLLIALLAGMAVVVQAQVWLARVGQSGLLGPVLVAVIIREAGPLLVNFIIIGRSGAAIAAELAGMRVSGQIGVLEGQGLDPFAYLVAPRVLGVAISVFCLTILFIAASFLSGFVWGHVTGAAVGTPAAFWRSVMKAIGPSDVLNVLFKTFLPGLLTGAICCLEGLGVRGALTEVPQAATRAIVRSVTALFIASALISILTYL